MKDITIKDLSVALTLAEKDVFTLMNAFLKYLMDCGNTEEDANKIITNYCVYIEDVGFENKEESYEKYTNHLDNHYISKAVELSELIEGSK